MTRVFISYCTEDMESVSTVLKILQDSGNEPYLAERDTRPGKLVGIKVETEILGSDAFCVLLSEPALRSNWVQQEIGFAKGRRPIIPITIGKIELPALLQGMEYVPFKINHLLELPQSIEKAIKEFNIVTKLDDKSNHKICDTGTFGIDAGEYHYMELNVSAGEKIEGHLSEKENRHFDWYIVDETNLIRFKAKEYFNTWKGSESVSVDRIKWKIPKIPRGPWFIILSARGRQIPRIIHLDIRRKSQ